MTELKVPFFRPSIGQAEVDEVVSALRSGWLTTGPRVKRFEREFAAAVGGSHSVALNSCTAALHLAVEALGLKPGQGVLIPTMTFAATGEIIRYLGGVPILVDCDPVTLNMSLADADRKLTNLRVGKLPASMAPDLPVVGLIPVHVGGFMMDPEAIHAWARRQCLWVVEDAAHAFPAAWRSGPGVPWRRCGEATAAVSCFSFYANKTITTGEGGMAITDDAPLAERMRLMSLHGLSQDAWERYSGGKAWDYRIVAPGYKYNLTDVAAAIGLGQLARAEQMRLERERRAPIQGSLRGRRRARDSIGRLEPRALLAPLSHPTSPGSPRDRSQRIHGGPQGGRSGVFGALAAAASASLLSNDLRLAVRGPPRCDSPVGTARQPSDLPRNAAGGSAARRRRGARFVRPPSPRDGCLERKREGLMAGEGSPAAVPRGLPRPVELAVAALGLVLCAPVVAVAGLLIGASSRGPIFFRQERVGRGGKRFVIYKLRTMRNASAGALVTARGDGRITPVGRILRKTKLDELPQLWNVVRGEMSLVGPRPEVPRYVNLDDPLWSEALRIRPGITDPVTLELKDEESVLAGIGGDLERFYREELLPAKLRGYVAYARSRSWLTDIEVLYRTVLAIVRPGAAAKPTAGTSGNLGSQ